MWEQSQVVFDLSNNDEVFGVVCSCVCKVCNIKEGE